MNKTEFVKELSLELDLPITFCEKLLEKEFLIIKKQLNTGGEIVFKNLGRLFVNVKSERILKINNKEYLIPQKNETRIKLFKGFKNIVK